MVNKLFVMLQAIDIERIWETGRSRREKSNYAHCARNVCAKDQSDWSRGSFRNYRDRESTGNEETENIAHLLIGKECRKHEDRFWPPIWTSL